MEVCLKAYHPLVHSSYVYAWAQSARAARVFGLQRKAVRGVSFFYRCVDMCLDISAERFYNQKGDVIVFNGHNKEVVLLKFLLKNLTLCLTKLRTWRFSYCWSSGGTSVSKK